MPTCCQLLVSDGRAAPLQQCFEGVRLEEIKRLDYEISAQILTVVTYAYGAHACTTCAFDTGDGVFYHNAPLGRYADSRGRSQIDFRIRFSLADIFSRDDRLKRVSGRQRCKDHLDVRTRRRRGNCLKPSLLVKLMDPTRDPG